MKKSKIMAIILSAAMLTSIPKVNTLAKSNNDLNNKVTISNNTEDLQDACITNKSGDLKVIDDKGNILHVSNEGEMIKVYNQEGDKALVRLQRTGIKGYIESSNILTIKSGDINNVTRMNRLGSIINVSSAVNVRKGPSMKNDVVDLLNNGTNIRITGKTGQWYRVSVNGLKGFIFEEYVKEGQDSNTKQYSHKQSKKETVNHKQGSISESSTQAKASDKESQWTGDHKGSVVHNVNNDGKGQQWTGDAGKDSNVKPANPSKDETSSKVTTTTPSTSTEGQSGIHKVDLNKPSDEKEQAKPSEGIHQGTEGTGSQEQAKPAPQKPEQGEHKVVNPGEDVPSHQKGDVVHGQGTAGQGGVQTGEQHQGTVIQPSKPKPAPAPEQKPAPKPAPQQGQQQGQGKEQGQQQGGVHQGTEGTGGVHQGDQSTKPAPKPAEKPMPAPTLTAHDVRVYKGVAFDYSLLKAQANEGAKVTYSGMPDTSKTGTYKVVVTATNSQGGKTQTTVNVTVVDNTPQLTAHNYEVKLGSKFDNSMLGAHAEGCNISYSGEVNTSKPGTYPVTISANNEHGGKATVTVNVKVVGVAPTISGNDLKLPYGHKFDQSLLGLKATSCTGDDLTSEIKLVDGSVNSNEAGDYKLTYSVTDAYGMSSKIVLNVTVAEKPAEKPVTPAPQKPVEKPVTPAPEKPVEKMQAPTVSSLEKLVLNQGDKYSNDLLQASANENAKITYSGDVNTETPGTYKVTITATNSEGTSTSREVEVVVRKVLMPAPEIKAEDKVELIQGSTFLTSMLHATANEDAKITYAGTVDTSKVGDYKVTIIATNKDGVQSVKEVTVTVKPQPHVDIPAPVVTVAHDTINLVEGDSFRPEIIGAKATVNGKEISVSYSGEVNTDKAGTYHVTVIAKNEEGDVTTKEVTVNVKAAPLPAPVLNVKNETVTITEGDSFSNDMFGASATVKGNPVSISYNGSVDNDKAGTYHLTIVAENGEGLKSEKEVTVEVKAKPVVKLPAPEITGHDVTININDQFDNSMLGAKATVNGEDVSVSYSGDVIQNRPGTYHVTVSAVNSQGLKSEKEFTVTVNDTAPTLIAHNFEMIQGGDFSIDNLNIQATAADGTDLSKSAKIVSGEVKINEPGEYKLTVEVTDAYGESTSQEVTVTVKERKLEAPVIEAKDLTITQGDNFDNSMIGATATCEGEPVEVSYNGNVDVNKAGVYKVTVTATNRQGTSSTKEITVTVKAKEEGWKWIDQSKGIGEYKGVTYYTNEGQVQQMLNDATFQKINEFRQQQGKSAYERSNALDEMSHWKDDNMNKYDYYEHACGGTNNPFHGLHTYQVFGPQIEFSGWCENLAIASGGGNADIYKETGIKAFSKQDIDDCANGVVGRWIASPLHRKNLLGDYKYCGVWTDANIYADEYGNVHLGGGATMNAASPDTTFDPVTFESKELPMPNSVTTPNAQQSQQWAREHSGR
ncbi:immunoglobulin-like domain-containing protein [Clostridium perfringens]